MTMFSRSRSNLATWFTLSMGSIFVLFVGILYLREAQDRLHRFDEALYDTSRIMAAGVENYVYKDQERTDLENVPVLGSDTLPLSSELAFARWYTAEQELLQFSGEAPPRQLEGATGLQTIAPTASSFGESQKLRQLTLPVYQGQRLIGYLQLAASLSAVEGPLQQLRAFLAVLVPMALGTIAITGWLLGGKAIQPIRRAYQQLQQFTADASHELRTPIAGILSHAQVGLMEPIDPQEQHDRLTTIAAVAESMGLLVGQLLFLARHDAQLSPQMLRPLDLVQLIQPLVEREQAQGQAQQQTLRWTLPPSLVVLAEPDLLRQAITNLLTNAHRYTPQGGAIAVRLSVSNRWALLEVQDDGMGIGAADLPSIFDRFYRADQARSRQTGGFGLGLAITRQIVEAHGGEITVKSRTGEGSTFTVRLPLSPLAS